MSKSNGRICSVSSNSAPANIGSRMMASTNFTFAARNKCLRRSSSSQG